MAKYSLCFGVLRAIVLLGSVTMNYTLLPMPQKKLESRQMDLLILSMVSQIGSMKVNHYLMTEEILGDGQSTWFSTTGKALAFIKYNDTLVQEYHLQYYAKHGAGSYPKEIDLKYPKPGTPNPVASLYISIINSQNSTALTVPIHFQDRHFEDDDRIFTQVNWLSDTELLVRAMNRVQALIPSYCRISKGFS